MQKRPTYNWPLSPDIAQRLGSSYGAQRTLAGEGQLLLILHAPPTPGKPREHEVFLRLPNDSSGAPTGQGRWLYEGLEGGQSHLVRLLDRYAATLDALESAQEVANNTEALFDIIGPCIPLARASSNMQAALQNAREAAPEDLFLIDQRDRAVEIARGFELLLADARMALDYRMAVATEAQIHATREVTLAQRKLNVIAALTFPLMAIGAAMGMNLHSGVEAVHGVLFWGVIVAGLILGLLIKRWVGGPSVRDALLNPASTASPPIAAAAVKPLAPTGSHAHAKHHPKAHTKGHTGHKH